MNGTPGLIYFFQERKENSYAISGGMDIRGSEHLLGKI
jgi:hypothetical protein